MSGPSEQIPDVERQLRGQLRSLVEPTDQASIDRVLALTRDDLGRRAARRRRKVWGPLAAAVAVGGVTTSAILLVDHDARSGSPAPTPLPPVGSSVSTTDRPVLSPTVGRTSSPVIAPPGSSQPPSASQACRTSDLRLGQGEVQGTAGGGFEILTLRNAGGSTCLMRGFPGVSVLDSRGAIIQRPAERDDVATTLVTLSPGQSASFVVRFSDPAIAGTGCSTTARPVDIQIYPPDQTQALRAPTLMTPCDLVVRPVMPSS
jgi:hypothetical protein